jgi:uncharacterized protein YegJ (DUF2314 family)
MPELVPIGFGVYFKQDERPLPESDEVKSFISAWLDRHASDPFRSAIQECIEKGLLSIDVREKRAVPVPPLEMLQCMSGEGEIERFRAATHLVMFAVPDRVGPPYIGLWGAVAAARAVAEALGGVIFDPEIPQLVRMESCTEPLPADGRVKVADHMRILFSVERSGLGWMTTKGMGKFGLPELQIRDVPPNLAEALMHVVNGIAQLLLAQVGMLSEAHDTPREMVLEPEIRFGLQEMAGEEADGPVEAPEGIRGWTMIRMQYQPGRRGSSSFLTLMPPRGFRGNQGVWLNSLLTDLFGDENTMRIVPPDSEAMEAAHMRAVEELPKARYRFQAGLHPGETLYVKHGFPTGEHGHEYMWLVVNTWSGDRVHGQLANDPQIRLDLRAGQEVELRESELYDWMFSLPGGETEGGYTTQVVEREGQTTEV